MCPYPGPCLQPGPSPLLDSNIYLSPLSAPSPSLNNSPGPCPDPSPCLDLDLTTSLDPLASPTTTLAQPNATSTSIQLTPAAVPPYHPMVTRLRAGVIQPKTRIDETMQYPFPHGLLSVGVTNEPIRFSQAQKQAEWPSAITEEINALLKNNTWPLVPHSPYMLQLAVNGSFGISKTLMAVLNSTRPAWLPKFPLTTGS